MTMLVLAATTAQGADAVTGAWKTEAGETATISRCGTDYCIIAKTGKFAGEKLGTFSSSDGDYTGRLTDPQTRAIYSGKLVVSGDSLKLRGCATTVLCKTQTWTRAK
jgi:uncharacterized protein (DUF2147 family)